VKGVGQLETVCSVAERPLTLRAACSVHPVPCRPCTVRIRSNTAPLQTLLQKGIGASPEPIELSRAEARGPAVSVSEAGPHIVSCSHEGSSCFSLQYGTANNHSLVHFAPSATSTSSCSVRELPDLATTLDHPRVLALLSPQSGPHAKNNPSDEVPKGGWVVDEIRNRAERARGPIIPRRADDEPS
jgi:hypothetical protein